ncbi:hypothetical protein P9112_004579 [Eukaryota sp. TZLM1-RC]
MESVFNLIPKPVEEPKKAPLYRSKHSGVVPSKKCSHATIGRPEAKPKTDKFLKKFEKTGTMTHLEKSTEKYERHLCHERKPPVPKKHEVPQMGLVSTKSFITTNAVEACLQRPPAPTKNNVQYTKKPDYGTVPAYLETIKKEVEQEYDTLRHLQEERNNASRQATVDVLSEEERQELLQGLRQRWDEAYQEFSRLPMVIDTESKINRKNYLERLMNQLEQDIAKLEKGLVLIN